MTLPAPPPEAISFALDYITGKALDFTGGAIARRGRPVLARVLGRVFGAGIWTDLIAGPDLDTGKVRGRDFIAKLDARIDVLEQSRAHDDVQLDAQFARPEVTAALASAFEAAMQTDAALHHDTLADLVIEALRAPSGSGWGPATHIAIQAMPQLVSRQVRLLGIVLYFDIFFVGHPDRGEDALRKETREHLLQGLTWALGVPIHINDFAHLGSLGLVEYDMSRGFLDGQYNSGPLAELQKFPDLNDDPELAPLLQRAKGYYHANSGLGIPAVAACSLSPAGKLIARTVLRDEIHMDVELGKY